MTKPAPIDDVPIGGEVMRLGQFVKFAGLLDSEWNRERGVEERITPCGWPGELPARGRRVTISSVELARRMR